MEEQQYKQNILQTEKRKMIIAIDFDGTIVEDKWPEVGPLKSGCKEAINDLINQYKCEVIIWTCREADELRDAIKFLNDNDIKYTSVNENTPFIKASFPKEHDCRKVYADLYVDDKSLHFSALNNEIKWSEIIKHILSFKMKNKQLFL